MSKGMHVKIVDVKIFADDTFHGERNVFVIMIFRILPTHIIGFILKNEGRNFV